MVRTCAVPSCKGGSRKKKVSWHRLPTDPERSLKWRRILRDLHEQMGSTFKLCSSTAVCSKHFPRSVYNNNGRLQYDAVPSIFHHQSANKTCTTATSAVIEVATGNLQSAGSSTSNECVATEPELIEISDSEEDLAHAESVQESVESTDTVEEIVQNENHPPPNHPSGSHRSAASSPNANESEPGPQTPASRPRKFYLKDLSPSDFGTPHKAKLNLGLAKQEVFKARNRAKMYWQKMTRAKKKIKDLQSILKYLKDKRLVNEDVFNTLQVLEKLSSSILKGLSDVSERSDKSKTPP